MESTKMSNKYLVNKTQTHVSIFEPPKLIPLGGFLEVTAEQADSVEVTDTVRRGWIEVSDKEPKAGIAAKPEMKIEKPAIEGSLEFPGKKTEPVVEAVEAPAVTEAVVEKVAPKASAKKSPN